MLPKVAHKQWNAFGSKPDRNSVFRRRNDQAVLPVPHEPKPTGADKGHALFDEAVLKGFDAAEGFSERISQNAIW